LLFEKPKEDSPKRNAQQQSIVLNRIIRTRNDFRIKSAFHESFNPNSKSLNVNCRPADQNILKLKEGKVSDRQ
jgi:hypothetical protein